MFDTRTGMQISLRRVAAFMLVALLISACVCALAACDDKNGQSEEERRAAALASFDANVLAAFNDVWTPDMPREEVVNLTDCGRYVETSLWLDLVGEVLNASSLQTAKIELLAEFAASEDGKGLVRDAADNLSAALDLINAVGFTSSDVQDLGFGLLRSVTENIAALYRSAEEELTALLSYVVGTGRSDVNAALERVERVLATDFADAETVAAAVAALDEAEGGIKTLLGFVYDTERTFGGGTAGDNLGSLLEGLSSGALADISETEMFVWLDSLVRSIEEFGADMTAETTSGIKTAIQSVQACFDGFTQPVDVVDEALEWLTYIGAFADELPVLADYAVAALDVLYERDGNGEYTHSFIRKLKSYAAEEDDALRELNAYILAAGLMSSFADGVDAEELKAEVDAVAASGDSTKRLSLYLGAMLGTAATGTPLVITEDDYAAMGVEVFYRVFETAFDNAYRDYVLNPEEYENRVRSWAGIVINYVGSMNAILEERGEAAVPLNVTNRDEITADWRNAILTAAEEVSERVSADTGDGSLPEKAAAEIKAQIDALYSDGLDDIRALAAEDLITDADSEAAERVRTTVASNPALYIFAMLLAL